jgi:hypothetical protein
MARRVFLFFLLAPFPGAPIEDALSGLGKVLTRPDILQGRERGNQGKHLRRNLLHLNYLPPARDCKRSSASKFIIILWTTSICTCSGGFGAYRQKAASTALANLELIDWSLKFIH